MLQIDVMQKKYVCMYACMLNCVDTPFFCTNNICIVYIVYQHNIGIKKMNFNLKMIGGSISAIKNYSLLMCTLHTHSSQ